MFASMRSVMFCPFGTCETYLLTGSSRVRSFSSAYCNRRVTVTVLVMLPMRMCMLVVIGAPVAMSARPSAATYVPSPGNQMPTIAPGALNCVTILVIAVLSAATVAAGNCPIGWDDGLAAAVAVELLQPVDAAAHRAKAAIDATR